MSDFLSLAAPGIADLKPYVPGKPLDELERELGLTETIKLASNENPLGPSPAGLEGARRALEEIHRYPDDNGHRLKARLAEHLGVAPEQLLLGAGSSDVIAMVARTFLAPGRNAVFSRYAFAMYPIYTTACGAQCRVAEARPEEDPMPLGHDLEAMARLVDDQTRVVFIANPNNPTGTWLEREPLRAFLEGLPDSVVVVLDEAYTEYVEEPRFPNGVDWIGDFPNLMVTRTFSKIYGLAGLRVGYGVAQAELIDLVGRVRAPFNVSLPALAAAEGALDDVDFVAASRRLNTAGLARFREALPGLGLTMLPSVANFVAVRLPRPGAELYQALLRRGIIVRPVDNYGMPDYLRITIGTEEENARVLAALEEELAP